MTAGRSCIDSSTPSTTGPLNIVLDPMEFMRHIRVPPPFWAASGCANRQSCRFGMRHIRVPPPFWAASGCANRQSCRFGMRHIRVPPPFWAASGCANRQSCRFGIARLAAPEVPLAQRARSVPRPRAHLTRYHGVFAPNFIHRHHIVPNRAHQAAREPHAPPPPMNWMQRLKRVFHIDIEHCGVCGGTLRVIACIETPLKCRSRSELARSSRGSSLISPPARPAPSTTPAHRRSVWAPRNPAPPITDHLLTAPTGAPRPRCASSTPCGPPPA